MLKDIPYNELKQDGLAYEIMLLRDQYDNTYTNIAKKYKMSVTGVAKKYNRIKMKQIHLYINHISVVLGYENNSEVMKVYDEADKCYQNRRYACAYLEKKYEDILTEYRNGEPGTLLQFIKSLPPFKPKLSKKTIARVIEMRETQQASFVAIAKELHITQAKARHTYEMFYHKQVLELVKTLQKKAESIEEKNALWDYCFMGKKSAKKAYDLLTKNKNPTRDCT